MKSNSRIHKQQQVQVVIRLKPEPSESRFHRCAYASESESNSLVVETVNKKEYFFFDSIADENIAQETLYQNLGHEAVSQSLEGYNCCIFAYGQTGSGKTYSILGVLQDLFENIYAQTRGILPRLLEDLFVQTQKRADKSTVKCSYMEIYNEQILDLLSDTEKILQIRQDIKKGVFVQNLTQEKTLSYEEAIEMVLQGERNRKIAATNMNSQSSRSHAIFTVVVESEIEDGDTIKSRKSKINIVDLAGSERVKHTNVEGQRLKQGCNINKSLHVLGNVINALVESTKKKKHIPFRDSKLTHFLKDSLGGNSITKLLANIQCGKMYIGDTLSTLAFAKRAKILKNKVEVNENTLENNDALRKEVKRLREQLAQAKYIRQTRMSEVNMTEGDNEAFEKYDFSNFDYSSSDKSLQVFEDNEMHYKALIEIYEQHLSTCQAAAVQEGQIANTFTKKRLENHVLTYNDWKKVKQENAHLKHLLKTTPAFSRIFRENQMLKQQRREEAKTLSGQKGRHFNQSTTLQLEEPSESEISRHSLIPGTERIELQRYHQQQAQKLLKSTVEQYENLLEEVQKRFISCIEEMEVSYKHLQQQVEQKDQKIKEIYKAQNHHAPGIQELIDENQILKLEILEREAEIDELQTEMEHHMIRHKEEGRRHSLYQEPSSNQKFSSSDPNLSRSDGLNVGSKTFLEDKQNEEADKQELIGDSELLVANQAIDSLHALRMVLVEQREKFSEERGSMVECIKVLQKQYKRMKKELKNQSISQESLKLDIRCMTEQVQQKYPDFQFDKKQLNSQSLVYEEAKFKKMLNLERQQNAAEMKTLQSLNENLKFEMQELYRKIQQLETSKLELEKASEREKAVQKQFGKSIAQIIQEYTQMLQRSALMASKTPSTKFQILRSHRSSNKFTDNKMVSPRIAQRRLDLQAFNEYGLKNKQQTQIGLSRPEQQRQKDRNSSKNSSSKQKKVFAYRSPNKK